MKYLETAFQQLEFAWKLYNYALEGRINVDELDKPITFQSEDQSSIFVLQNQLFHSLLRFQIQLKFCERQVFHAMEFPVSAWDEAP